jgi:hypothetical protein
MDPMAIIPNGKQDAAVVNQDACDAVRRQWSKTKGTPLTFFF